MKLHGLLLAVLFLSTIACDSNDDNNGITPETTTYEFYDSAKMVITTNQGFETLNIETGTNTVFKYFFMAEDNEDINDDEYSESIYFEIDGSLDSFSFSNAELRNSNLFIGRSCFCANTGFVFIETGSVSGTKLSNGNWDVSITISFQWQGEQETQSRTISGTFLLKPIP